MIDITTTILEPAIRRTMGARRGPVRLRGVMFDIPEEKGRAGAVALPPALHRSAHAQLMDHAPEAR